jgi:hypothetical protein
VSKVTDFQMLDGGDWLVDMGGVFLFTTISA